MDTSKITSLTCGILFKKSFGIMDMWGAIVDQTIYKSKFFSPEYFPNVASQYTMQGELANHELGHYLRLSYENLVYRHSIQHDFDKEYKDFLERVSKYLVPQIIFENHLDVRRLGVVFTYELSNQEEERVKSKYFKPEIKGISDFRFSRKEATVEGGVIAGNSDYINKIYTVGAIGADKVGITYDYQLHFNPPRECVTNIITKFLGEGLEAFKKDIGTEV